MVKLIQKERHHKTISGNCGVLQKGWSTTEPSTSQIYQIRIKYIKCIKYIKYINITNISKYDYAQHYTKKSENVYR